MAKRNRKTRNKKMRLSAAYVIVVVLLVSIALAVIYGPVTGTPAYSTTISFPNMPSIGTSVILFATHSTSYYLANSTSSTTPSSNGSVAYQHTAVFLYHNYTATAGLPASISATTIVTASNASASSQVISIIFGGMPNGETDGYVQNASNPMQNSTYNATISGVNVTFYNIYQSTQTTELPLYQNTSVSPPVFEYLTVFRYGSTVGDIESLSQKPLPNGAVLNLNISEALAENIISSG